jgi:hypothetical protein
MKRLFQIGQRIVFIDNKLKGKVIKNDEKQLIIELDCGLSIPALEKDIIPESDSIIPTTDYPQNTAKKQPSEFKIDPDIWSKRPLVPKIKSPSGPPAKDLPHNVKKAASSKKKRKSGEIPEIDLHLENLLNENQFVAPENALAHQLESFKVFLDDCREKKAKKAIVIHGEGKGVLKNEVRKHIQGCIDCDFEDAPLRTYGVGATLILFRTKIRTFF